MKRFLMILGLVLICSYAFISCSDDIEVPEGLQIVDNNSGGYIFFGPEGWIISNRAGISASYVSPVNGTSISFTEADMPDVGLNDYFDQSFSSTPYSVNVLKKGESCNFGNADEAYKYVYTFRHGETDFAAMQILVKNGEGFYIFTYNSYGDPEDETSQYRAYLEQVQLAIDNFKFTDGSDESSEPEYPLDGDGYKLISNGKITGFELYVPESYNVIDSSTLTTARISEGANISLTKATGTGVSIADYWKTRLEELSAFVSDLTEISVNNTNTDGDGVDVKLGNLESDRVASYEYTYSYGGNIYHVYQVMGVDSFNGYVFTYTALESEYESHLSEINIILEKVKF